MATASHPDGPKAIDSTAVLTAAIRATGTTQPYSVTQGAHLAWLVADDPEVGRQLVTRAATTAHAAQQRGAQCVPGRHSVGIPTAI